MSTRKLQGKAACGFAILFALLLTGCGPYVMKGRVIDGAASAVLVVPANDPRITNPYGGLPGTRISLELNPQSLGRKPLGDGISQDAGRFEVPVTEFGAGSLEYNVGVLARRPGYAPAENMLRLPGSDKRLLIILHRGVDRSPRPDDPLDDLRRFGSP